MPASEKSSLVVDWGFLAHENVQFLNFWYNISLPVLKLSLKRLDMRKIILTVVIATIKVLQNPSGTKMSLWPYLLMTSRS